MFFKNFTLSLLSLSLIFINTNDLILAQNKLSVDEINLIAKKTTVLIAPQLTQEDLQNLIENKSRETSGSWGVGSGVIIGRKNNKYFVLTVAHNFNNTRLNDNQSYAIVTNDRKVHILNNINDHRGEPKCPPSYDDLIKINIPQNSILLRFGCYNGKKVNGYDIALVSFESNESYPIAPIGDANSLNPGDKVYISGWPKLENEPKLSSDGTPLLDSEGKIVCMGMAPRRQRRLAWSPLQGKLKFLENLNGYNLLYLDYTRPGMSGGPIFNSEGYLVGIHGQGSKNKLQCGQVYQSKTQKISSNINESDELDETDVDNAENLEDESVSNTEQTVEEDSLDVEDIEEEVKISESEEEADEKIVDNTTIEKSKNNEFSKGQNLNNVLTLLGNNKEYFSPSKSPDSILSQLSSIKTNSVSDANLQGNKLSSGRIEFGAFDDQTDEIEDVYQLFSFKLENMLRLQPSGGCGSLLLGDKCPNG